jgi:hypothetical protein
MKISPAFAPKKSKDKARDISASVVEEIPASSDDKFIESSPEEMKPEISSANPIVEPASDEERDFPL